MMMEKDDLELTWDADPRTPSKDATQVNVLPGEPLDLELPEKNPDTQLTIIIVVLCIMLGVFSLVMMFMAGRSLLTERFEPTGFTVRASGVGKIAVAELEEPGLLEPVEKKRVHIPEPTPRPDSSPKPVSRDGTEGWGRGVASWYGPGLYGNRTADGTPYTPETWCVAHKTLPFGTNVKIRYNGKEVTVPVKDRGPFTPGREWDLSNAVAKALGFSGVHTIEYKIVR